MSENVKKINQSPYMKKRVDGFINNDYILLKLFSYVFYYEKNLQDNELENIFILYGEYYLINEEWINQFKVYYKYEKVYKSLYIISQQNPEINYKNLDYYIDSFIKKYANNNNNFIPFEKYNFSKKLKEIDIEYSKNKQYILESKIMELINECLNQNYKNIEPKKLIKKENNNMFLIDKYNIKIIIGNINEDTLQYDFKPIFNRKCILSYKSIQILSKEKEILLDNSLDNYINYRKCNKLDPNKQILIDDKNNELGNLIIITKNKIKITNFNEVKKRNIDNNLSSDNIEINNSNNSVNPFQKKNNVKLTCFSPDIVDNMENPNIFLDETKKTQNINYFNISKIEVVENKSKEENKKLNNKINELENKINKLNNENNELKVIINKKENEIIELKKSKNIVENNKILNQNNNDGEIRNLKTENEELKKKNLIINNQLVLNQSNIQKYNKLNDIIQAKDKELIIMKNKIEEEKNKNNILESEINNLKIAINNLNNNNNSNNILNENLKEENNNIKNELNKQIKLNKEYETKIMNYENIIKNLEKDIKNKNIEINIRNQKYKNENNVNNKKEEELKNRLLEIEKRENEFNKKMNYLEDKENQIENENQKLNKKLQINKDLNNKNKELEKLIKEKQNQYNQLIHNIQNKVINNSNILVQKNKSNAKNSILKNNYINLNQEKLNNDTELKLKKEQENLFKKLKKQFITKYIRPTLIGLDNIGATCFMNATLQCLSQTEDLTNYFLNPENENKIKNNNIAILKKNEYQLTPVYYELVNKLWQINGPKSFPPYSFMNVINAMNPLFKKGEPGDSKDFIIFILEQFHKELKKPANFNQNNNINQPLNQYDKSNIFNHFFNSFKQETSIISDVFFGIIETTNECQNCKNIYNSQGFINPICYNYQIFNCLIFPLEEVKNMKNNLMQFNNNCVTLDDCFIYNQKSEYFSGPNRNYCNLCKQLYDSIYTSRIFVCPNTLVLILNRGKENIYNVKLDFKEKINISQYVLQKEKPNIIYTLYGVITHIGKSGPSAHFVASCRSPVDFKWYRYNDSIVTLINDVQKDIIDFGTPYILFYQKN